MSKKKGPNRRAIEAVAEEAAAILAAAAGIDGRSFKRVCIKAMVDARVEEGNIKPFVRVWRHILADVVKEGVAKREKRKGQG